MENNYLSSIFGHANPYVASDESMNKVIANLADIWNTRQEEELKNPINKILLAHPDMAQEQAQQQTDMNKLNLEGKGWSNRGAEEQYNQLYNKSRREGLEMASDYPFLAKDLPQYPTNPKDVAQFVEDLKHGRDASSSASLLEGGKALDSYKELLGIKEKEQTIADKKQEGERNTHSAIIGAFNSRSPYAKIPEDKQDDPITARAVADLSKDSESLKAMDTVNQTLAPILNDIQKIRNFIRERGGIPRGEGQNRDEYTALTGGLTLKLGRLYGAGQSLRMSPAILHLIEDTAGNPNGWSARMLWDDAGVEKNLDSLQDSLISSVPHAYPSYVKFDYDSLANDLEDPELKKKIGSAGKHPSSAEEKPTYGKTDKKMLGVVFTDKSGKTKEALIPESSLELAQKRAKEWGGSLSIKKQEGK